MNVFDYYFLNFTPFEIAKDGQERWAFENIHDVHFESSEMFEKLRS
jgi:hypothetical protein